MRNPWRREFFPNYKANRKKLREKDDKDWGVIFNTLQVIKDELRDNFPYRYMYVENCEADDIIAVLHKTYIYRKRYLIVSGDKDFPTITKI